MLMRCIVCKRAADVGRTSLNGRGHDSHYPDSSAEADIHKEQLCKDAL